MNWEELDAGLGDWLAGFTDGEGCFTIKAQPISQRGHLCRFKIALRSDDRPILDHVRSVIGAGVVRTWPADPRSVEWVVATKTGVAAIVNLFETYPLRAKKRHDFVVWREAVIAWNSAPPDFFRMGELKRELEDGRSYESEPPLARRMALQPPQLVLGS